MKSTNDWLELVPCWQSTSHIWQTYIFSFSAAFHVFNPMVDTATRRGQVFTLQSAGYPDMKNSILNKTCHIQTDRSVILETMVYDLTYAGNFTTPPYCINFARGDYSVSHCARRGQTQMTFSDRIEYQALFQFQVYAHTPSSFQARFWIVLTVSSGRLWWESVAISHQWLVAQNQPITELYLSSNCSISNVDNNSNIFATFWSLR